MVSRILKLLIPLLVGLAVLLISLLLMFVVFPSIIENEITTNVELKEDTLQWYRFREFPFPFQFAVYLYTVKNKDAVLQNKRPIVEEVGPFIYDEFRTRVILSADDRIITYNEQWSFKFNQDASFPRNENETITVINSPLLAVLQNLENPMIPVPPDLIKKIIGEMFESTDLFIDVKPRDLSFDGIKMCHKPNQSALTKVMCLAVMLMNQKLLEYNLDLSMSFSLFKYKTKPDGPFTLERGLQSVENVGLITSYKGMEYTKYWKGEESQCDKVNGYFTTFPPFIEEDSTFQIYSSDICKSAILNFAATSEFKDVPTYQFQTNGNSFASPNETCVCIDETKGLDGKTHCFNTGVLDLNTCMGVPVILSFPHLMWADDQYRTSINDTTQSNENIHNTMISFEPHLGQPLQGSIRLQFNVVLRPIMIGKQVLDITSNWPRSLFPIVWIDDSFELSDNLLAEIDDKLLSQLKLADIVQYTLIGIGALLCLISICLLIFCRKK